MFQKIFQKAGLSPTQAKILDYLYQYKEERASKIARAIKKSRSITYQDLDEMVDLKLVRKDDRPDKVTTFRLEHPTNIEKFFEKKESQIKRDRALLQSYLPNMISHYNLLNNKPGIRFFEGQEGIVKVLKDTLKSKTEIYTITDSRSVRQTTAEINREYVEERRRNKIKKKLIIPESSRKIFIDSPKDQYTEIKFLDDQYCTFKTGIQIYDNKISYQTLEKDNQIGLIIEDKNIYEMHQKIFEYLWSTLAIS